MSLSPLPKNHNGNTVLIKLYIGIYTLVFYIHMYICIYTPVYMECLQHDASCTSCYGQAGKKWTGQITRWMEKQLTHLTKRVASKDWKFKCQLVTTGWLVRVDTGPNTIQCLRNDLHDKSDCTLTKLVGGTKMEGGEPERRATTQTRQPAGRWGQEDLYKV